MVAYRMQNVFEFFIVELLQITLKYALRVGNRVGYLNNINKKGLDKYPQVLVNIMVAHTRIELVFPA